MKRNLLTLLSLFMIAQLQAQKFEFTAQANTGLFHYSGNATTSDSYILARPSEFQSYTNNPYGNKNAFSYGAALQAQYVTKGGFIAGLQAGYDILRSNEDITKVYPNYIGSIDKGYYDFAAIYNTVSGHTHLQRQYINLSPYFGYRIKMKKVKLDLLPGFDIGFNTASHEYGKASTVDGMVYRTDLDRGTQPADWRLKFTVQAGINKWGIFAGYAHGLTNFTANLLNDSPMASTANSELFRVGISYRIL